MSWALVLGGGGPLELTWYTGLLKGLLDGGADLTRPDLLVGTSAGALVGAQMLTGRDLGELWDRQRVTAAGIATVRDGLADDEAWPERPLQVAALDDDTGALVVWTRAAGVPLALAVASSCPEPMAAGRTIIAGRRYRDPSPLSATSAALAYGHRLVVVLAAAPRAADGTTGPLEGELAQLRAGGSHVHLVTPDVVTAAAGYDQGRTLAEPARGWLDSLETLLPLVDACDLAARFAALALHKAEWTHVAHLAVGAWHVRRYGAVEALPRLRDGIRRLNVSIGGANTPSSGYHETITAAYVAMLAAFLDTCPPGLPLAECLARLWASPLAARDMLFTFYTRERLLSTQARAQWVDPDLAPLRLDQVV